jgi:hypothetical protein
LAVIAVLAEDQYFNVTLHFRLCLLKMALASEGASKQGIRAVAAQAGASIASVSRAQQS